MRLELAIKEEEARLIASWPVSAAIELPFELEVVCMLRSLLISKRVACELEKEIGQRSKCKLVTH